MRTTRSCGAFRSWAGRSLRGWSRDPPGGSCRMRRARASRGRRGSGRSICPNPASLRWSWTNRRSRALPLLVLLLLGLTGCGRRVARAVAEQGDPEANPGLIDVGLEGFTPEHHALGARLGEVLEDERLVDDPFDGVDEPEELLVLRVDPAREAAILDELRRRPDVHFAEPVVRVQKLWVPDDPQFAQQWHLRAAGATSAWDSARGAGVTVAVIDTGVAPVDDLDPARLLRGHNFLNDGDDARDDHGHGTHVAGTVAQTTDNGIGVAGMAPLARLLPLKVLGAD